MVVQPGEAASREQKEEFLTAHSPASNYITHLGLIFILNVTRDESRNP